jgi:hypothetical protein
MAVASRKDAGTWAVGFTTVSGKVKPLAMRWNGRTWAVDRPRMGGAVALFADVAIVGDGRPLAVGYRMARDGRRIPLVYRRDGPRWTRIPMSLGRRMSISLTGVDESSPGGIWVVGHGGEQGAVQPLVYERRNGKWKRFKLPTFKGEAVLTDVVTADKDESWAVGYQRHDGFTQPLVLRWNGKRWKRVKAPMVDASDVLLNAVSVDPAGGIWTVGAAWNDRSKAFESLAAWWHGQSWNVTTGPSGGTELNDVDGSLTERGWAVGRASSSSRVVHVCTPPQSGVFGSYDPAATTSGEPAGDLPVDDPELLDNDDLETYPDEDHADGNGRKPGRGARKLKKSIGTLPTPTSDKRIFARDVARAAGVFDDTGTYDAVVEDFDADGFDDLFIGRHGRKGVLMLNRNGVFVEHEPLDMTSSDRHGCAAADIDGSGLPDLYCAVGGKRGSGLKANELWLDPGGPAPTEVGPGAGLADPAGRGRLVAFLESRKQRATELVVTNSPTRVDGLPSLTRLFRANGKGDFRERTRVPVASRKGARAIQSADFDRDGREDLLLVTGGPQSPEPATTHIYRNTPKGLVDVTRKMRVRQFDTWDAELVDLNGDRKLDLVQISEIKLMVSLQKGGRFQKVYERNLTDGRAIASGDVNGDKRNDLYLVRSGQERNSPDVLLLNQGKGSKWSSLVIPQVYSGAGDDAYAIDHDGNGLDDFLVLNGHNARGPTQLVAFYRR